MPPRFQTYTCAVEPRMRSRSSCCKPVMIASAITSAMTPTVTPSVETSEMTEMNTWRGLDFERGVHREPRTQNEERRTNNQERGTNNEELGSGFSRTHQRKKNHVTNRRRVCQKHDQAIHADAFTACRRQAVLERANVVLVHFMRFLVAAGTIGELRLETAPLLRGVVQLAERVGDFHAADIQFKSLDRLRIVGALLRQR